MGGLRELPCFDDVGARNDAIDVSRANWKGAWIGGWTKRLPGVTGQPSYDPNKICWPRTRGAVDPRISGHS